MAGWFSGVLGYLTGTNADEPASEHIDEDAAALRADHVGESGGDSPGPLSLDDFNEYVAALLLACETGRPSEGAELWQELWGLIARPDAPAGHSQEAGPVEAREEMVLALRGKLVVAVIAAAPKADAAITLGTLAPWAHAASAVAATFTRTRQAAPAELLLCMQRAVCPLVDAQCADAIGRMHTLRGLLGIPFAGVSPIATGATAPLPADAPHPFLHAHRRLVERTRHMSLSSGGHNVSSGPADAAAVPPLPTTGGGTGDRSASGGLDELPPQPHVEALTRVLDVGLAACSE